jgi:hypothetical protein
LSGASSGWVVSWENDSTRYPDLVAEQAKQLDLLDFFWLSLAGTTEIAVTDQYAPAIDDEMDAVHGARPCTLGFVTLSDNWDSDTKAGQVSNRQMLAEILMDPRIQWQFILAMDQWMYDHPKVDGLTLDFEYGLPGNMDELRPYAQAGHWDQGLDLRQSVDRITTGYNNLVWSLGQAMHKLHRQLRVAALTRPSDVAEKDHIQPFVLNYGQIAADQLVLMATDYSWSTGNPGAIAPFKQVAHDVRYVLSYPGMTQGRLSIELPAYAYNWQVQAGRPDLIAKHGNTPIEAANNSQTEVDAMLARLKIQPLRTADGDTHWQFTQNGRPHVVWDAATALEQSVAKLRQAFPGCGLAVFRIGNSDPAGWKLVQQAFRNSN